jgi:GT2 family glycosyltransferase
MRVGLVIVTYNAEAWIRRALDAVRAQSCPPDRVIVFDNASADRTLAIVRETVRGWSIPAHVIEAGSNLGFAAGNNRAVGELADCDLVALLNPDAFPDPGWLATLVAAAREHPEAASFASRQLLDGHSDLLDGAGDVCHVSGLVWREGHGVPVRDATDAQSSGPVFSACAAAALYRRTDWVEAGGFDERFFCYAEDVDLGFRLQLAGRGCWYVAEAVVRHVGSATAGVGSDFAVYHGHRNLEWMFVKNMPAALLWRYLPLHLATWAAGFVHFAARGRAGAYARAKWDALRGLVPAGRDRRRVQATKVLATADVLALLDRRSLVSRFWSRN